MSLPENLDIHQFTILSTEMPHFFLHHRFSAGQVMLSRVIIQAIQRQFPEVQLTLACGDAHAYLWQDLGLPIQSYQGQPDSGVAAPHHCPPESHFINLGFGVFADLWALYGMTYAYQVHAYNRQISQYRLQHRYLLPLPAHSPMLTLPDVMAHPVMAHPTVVQPNGVLVENGPLPPEQNYFYLNEQLGQLVAEFPQLTFYCAAKPLITAPNLVDCSGLNLWELSWLSDRCMALLTRGGDVNAATYTEVNRLKPRCIVGWDLPIRLWGDVESHTTYAENLDQVRRFLASLHAQTLPSIVVASPKKLETSLEKPLPNIAKQKLQARRLSLCKFLLSRAEIDACTQYLLENGYLSHIQDCKNWDLAAILPDLSEGNLLDMGSSDSCLLQNVVHSKLKGEKYGIDLRKPTHPLPGVNYLVGDLMDTQLPDAFFQTVTCLSVLEHGVDFLRLAQEASRLLKLDGKLYLTFDYANPKVRSRLEMYERNWNILDASDVQVLVDCCEKCGLQLVQDIDWSVQDAVINAAYHSPDPEVSYTFGMLTFKKVSATAQNDADDAKQLPNIALSKTNWIAFPDWTIAEETLMQQLSDLVQVALNHPDRENLTLLVHADQVDTDDANLILSGVMMNLLMQEPDEASDNNSPELTITLLEGMDTQHWQWLIPQLQCRIILPDEALPKTDERLEMLPTIVVKYFAELQTDKFIRETYFPDFSFVGTMIEVGGATPDYLSMSKHFKLNGWRSIIIEPNPNFVALHQMQGNEVYEYACSYEDKDDVPFQVVNWLNNHDYDSSGITDHSFSAISVKEGYLKKHNYGSVDDLSYTTIRVQVRKLDSIISKINLERIDFISIDVEGWELEVMQGFSVGRFKPKVIVLENYLHDGKYTEFMSNLGYRLDAKIEYNYIYSLPRE